MSEQLAQLMIDKLFEGNPNLLVQHQLSSYNDFFKNGIRRILKENNPIKIIKEQDPTTGEYHRRCDIYLGGKDGDKIYYGRPVIFDDNREHYMYPNEARLRNMTYGITIHYSVDIDFFITPDDESEILTRASEKGVNLDHIIVKKANRELVPVYLSLSQTSIYFIKPLYSKQASSPTKTGEIIIWHK